MIRILAPTTIESLDEGSTVILEMDQESMRAVATAVVYTYGEGLRPTGSDTAKIDDLVLFFGEGMQK